MTNILKIGIIDVKKFDLLISMYYFLTKRQSVEEGATRGTTALVY
jgi:hypothetical protein